MLDSNFSLHSLKYKYMDLVIASERKHARLNSLLVFSLLFLMNGPLVYALSLHEDQQDIFLYSYIG